MFGYNFMLNCGSPTNLPTVISIGTLWIFSTFPFINPKISENDTDKNEQLEL